MKFEMLSEKLDFVTNPQNWNDHQKQRLINTFKVPIEKYIKDQFSEITKNKECIVATSSMALSPYLNHIHFDLSILDEAGQVLEPYSAIGLFRGERSVIIGDLNQLQAVVKSQPGKSGRYNTSTMERLIYMQNVPITTLKKQYRMDFGIHEFINTSFYKKELAYTKISNENNVFNAIFENSFPYIFIDVDYKENHMDKDKSLFNEDQHKVALILFEKLQQQDINKNDIAIITPYTKQKNLIQQRHNQDSRVATIDGFQGNEADYIIVSTVRSNTIHYPGFVGDYCRVNVSLSRAKKGCIVLGDLKTLNTRAWQCFFNYIAIHNAYFKKEGDIFRNYPLDPNDFLDYNHFYE
ncbi:hypothetical protein EIN_017580 [Entamoeba invadens IP1]|uniref:hypothetical protein n=1 Tax=Entamoeba invadens IP1 TaxID=370355 RepID=UPI0002C3E43C|nr:hypothetical protein EIN_017580 [Entamoeba invadens IP1]ELP90459.1 hypothetical protein EIN_017580 [Entamoeba invadens IP1]|eukprot:XP_004257230.1 hypothetical protein EIN_017580 [Entamoeba invadens IP1]